jgi:hypothetical protein
MAVRQAHQHVQGTAVSLHVAVPPDLCTSLPLTPPSQLKITDDPLGFRGRSEQDRLLHILRVDNYSLLGYDAVYLAYIFIDVSEERALSI